jgi:hypothetical protein
MNVRSNLDHPADASHFPEGDRSMSESNRASCGSASADRHLEGGAHARARRALARAACRTLERLEDRRLLAAGDPVISEFLASNSTGIVDDYNVRTDWVELYNPTGTSIDLTNWHLTDSKGTPNKWTFPAGTSLPANEHLVVFADGRNDSVGPGGRLHANFSLNTEGEYLALTRPDDSVAQAFDVYPEQLPNTSYGFAGPPTAANNVSLVSSGIGGTIASVLVPSAAGELPANWNAQEFDDGGWTTSGPTGVGYDTDPGSPNYDSSIRTDVESYMSGAGKNTSAFLRLPFTMSGVNDFQRLTLRMTYDDGFVAYLNGTKIAQANAPASPVWNSTATATVGKGTSATDFDVTAFAHLLRPGENVLAIHGLNDSSASPDFLVLPQLLGNRVTFGPRQYMTAPSPGAVNTAGALGRVGDTEFSVDRGFYDAAFPLRITSDTSGATIRYTLDGTLPTETTGTVYTGPITINKTTVVRAIAYRAGYVSSNVDAQSYIFLGQVIQQTGTGLPAAAAWGHAGPDWSMDPRIVQANPGIINDLKAVPSLSLSMPWNDWFGANGQGIYISGTGIERRTSVEMINPDGTKGFHVTSAVEIQGGTSDLRWKDDKLSMELTFKEPYGPSSLDYPIFGEDGGAVKSFGGRLVLDGVLNWSWVHAQDAAQRRFAKYITDQVAADYQAAVGGVAPHGRYMHLYLNGLYWGVYYVHEKPTEDFAADYQGGDKEDYDVIKHSLDRPAVAGTKANYVDLVQRVNAFAAAPTDANYQAVLDKLDVVDFVDYMIANFYGGNFDWAHQNWYASYNRVDPNGKWHFHTWDAEHVFRPGGATASGTAQQHALDALAYNATTKNDWAPNVTSQTGVAGPTGIHQRLRASAEYRTLFADRVQKHFFNGGAFTPANAAATFQRRVDEIDRAIVGESARWGDNSNQDPTAPHTREEWRQTIDALLAYHFPSRTGTVLGQLRSGTNPAFPANTNAPLLSTFGGTFAGPTSVTISKPTGVGTGVPQAGVIYYRLDGQDPRLPGGGVRSGSQMVTSSINVNLSASARLMARTLNGSEWSAVVDATFVIGNPPALRISEIMYNPAPLAGSTFTADDFEFVELTNTGATTINPSGFSFTNGIRYTFPLNAFAIPAGGRVVLARNPDAFATRYPGVTMAGIFSGSLDNGGERLTLTTQFGQVVENITYADGWFDATDGDGYSLTALNPAASDALMSTAAGWRASRPAGGTPGTAVDAAANGLTRDAVVINEVMANAGTGASNWIELRNTTGAAIDVGRWWLSNTKDNLRLWQIPAGTTLAANGYLSFDEVGGFGLAFQLSASGNDVYLTSNDGAGNPGGYRDHVDFGASDVGVSFGRHLRSTGNADVVAQAAVTRGAANTSPRVGPVVINEIMYNPLPTSGAPEYIELRNVTDAAVSLNGWRFTDGISFTFPSGTANSIPANGYALVVPIDPAVFRSTYGIPADVPIFGPYTGQLDNGGEKVTLAKPSPSYATTAGPYITIDRVTYDGKAPWPTAAAGTGPSVARINAGRYGNDPANWRADATPGTPGAANATAPVVLSDGFAYGAGGPRVSVKFGKPLASSPGQGLTILNRTTGQALAADQVTFSYDAATQTATWQLPPALANGNYRATLAAAAVTDAQGRPLDGNSDGTPGDGYTIDFYHLAGDANHDRAVNFADLLALAKSYNGTGKTWEQGDFNGDGSVNFADLLALAKNYNGTLPLAGEPVPATGMSSESFAAAMKAATPTPVTPVKPTVRPRAQPKPVAKPQPKPVLVAKPKPTSPAAASKPVSPPPAASPPAGGAFATKKITARVFD